MEIRGPLRRGAKKKERLISKRFLVFCLVGQMVWKPVEGPQTLKLDLKRAKEIQTKGGCQNHTHTHTLPHTPISKNKAGGRLMRVISQLQTCAAFHKKEG